MVTFAMARDFALTLPETQEGTSYGTPALKVRGTLLARLREEGDVLVVKVDMDYRELLLETNPATYFITPHYVRYPAVLVRLALVDEEELRALLTDAWRIVAPKRLVAAFDAR